MIGEKRIRGGLNINAGNKYAVFNNDNLPPKATDVASIRDPRACGRQPDETDPVAGLSTEMPIV